MKTETVSLSDGLPLWRDIEAGWPSECTATWQSLDLGRITDRQYVTVVRVADRPVAAATWMLMDGTESRRGLSAYDLILGTGLDMSLRSMAGRSAPWLRLVAKNRTALAATALTPCACVTIPSTTQPGLIWLRTLPATELDPVLAELIAAVSAAAISRGANAVLFSNLPATDPDWQSPRQALTRAGYQGFTQPATTALDIPADGMTGYLAAQTRHRRNGIRRELRVFAESTDRVSVWPGDRLREADLAELLVQRYTKYGHATSLGETADRLERASELPGMTVLVAERDGRACAFDAFLADRGSGRLVSRFNACEDNDFFAYFNLGYYEPLRYGAANGFTTLTLGTESYGAKLARGARIVGLDGYVLGVSPTIRNRLDEACLLRSAVERDRLAEHLPRDHQPEYGDPRLVAASA